MRAVCLGSSHLVSRWRLRAAWRVEAASRRRNRWQYWPIFLIISGGHSKSGGVIFVKEITPHAHMDKMVLFFYRCHDEQEGLARLWVSRASRRPRIQWTHAVCARTRQLVAAPPPAHVDAPPPMCLSPAAHTHTRSARPCRCPTTHVLLAARPRPSHTHSACHTAIPSHMCFSPRAPARLTYAVPTRPDPQLLLATRPRPSKTRVIAGLVHRHTQQRDGSIAHTGTSGTTPHGKNESIARAGITSKAVGIVGRRHARGQHYMLVSAQRAHTKRSPCTKSCTCHYRRNMASGTRY